MQPNSPSEFDADANRLEVGIRQLKVQYDMFFAGARKTEPLELRQQLGAIIKLYSRTPPRVYAQQFRFQALVSRFNTMIELWGKNVRSMEEGDRRLPTDPNPFVIKERLVARCLFTDPKRDHDSLKRLHTRYADHARRHGDKDITFDKFVRGVAAQARKLRETADCSHIELRVVVANDRVQVKARPGKTRAAGSTE